MIRFLVKGVCATALATGLTLSGSAPLRAATLELAFLPPPIEPQDICLRNASEDDEDDLTVEGGDESLTDRQRLLFLGRDIRRLQAEDAEKWFDFINTLITRMAQLDENFAGNSELLARVALFIDAGRLDDLESAGLVTQLRARDDLLSNNERMELAQYYLNGIGVARDEEYARELILNAGFGGNSNALFALARMQLEGKPVEGWDAPLDLTVTMALGGMLGQLTPGVCRRAERIAREYLSGDVVSRNPQIAQQWFRFAADMGSAEAAWRVVEYHLEADAAEKDNAVMLHYLKLAAQRGIAISEGQVDALKSSGAIAETELLGILGFNHSQDTGRHRPSIAPLLDLAVNIDGVKADPDDSLHMQYLQELAELPDAPGWVFTVLAKEVLVRRGRWAGEAEAMALFEEAAKRGDREGTLLLGKKLVRWRDDPVRLNRAVDLLGQAATRHGEMEAMDALDGLFRCQVNDAPRLTEAEAWARNYRATQHAAVGVSATDLIALDPFKEPLTIAQIQSQALDSRVVSLANYVQRIQVDPSVRPSAHRLWADRLDSSDQALEAFAELDFELATNPAERRLAVELFRRVYLNNGVTTALDLAIALVEDNAKDAEIADEIIDLLTRAGNRGEGAAMRLKARLLAPGRSGRSVFEEFETVIGQRGDFLALMFALPFVDPLKAEDYFDRAVSLMSCGTKDVEELSDAHALRNEPDLAWHWQRIGLAIEGGHVLSKLRLSDRQMETFDEGAAPTELDVYERVLAEGDAGAHRRLFRLTSDPDLQTYDPAKAANHLLALVGSIDPGDRDWVLATYRLAPPEVRDIAARRFDIAGLFQQAAQSGDIEAKLEFALLLRDTARMPGDLASSARLLQEAATAGSVTAMTEYGYVLAHGIGTARNLDEAVGWLDRAAGAGDARAERLAALFRLGAGQ